MDERASYQSHGSYCGSIMGEIAQFPLSFEKVGWDLSYVSTLCLWIKL